MIIDVQAKAERGELVVLPASVRPKATVPEEALDDTSRSSRSGPVLAAATEYSDEEDVPDLTVDIAIEEDVRSSDEALEETSSAPSTAGVPKRPRHATPQGEEINVMEPAADARPGSPKRPRLS